MLAQPLALEALFWSASSASLANCWAAANRTAAAERDSAATGFAAFGGWGGPIPPPPPVSEEEEAPRERGVAPGLMPGGCELLEEVQEE